RENATVDFAGGGGDDALRWVHHFSHGCGAQGRGEQGRDQRSAWGCRGNKCRGGTGVFDASPGRGGSEDRGRGQVGKERINQRRKGAELLRPCLSSESSNR